MEACLPNSKVLLTKEERKKLRKTKRAYAFLIIIYKALLDVLYVVSISRDYAYYGLDYFHSPQKIAMGYIFFFFVLIFMVGHIMKPRPSNQLMFFFELMYFVPGITFHTYSSSELPFFWFFIGFYFLFQLANYFGKKVVKENKPINTTNNKNKRIFFNVLVVFLLAFTVFYLVYYNGFRLKFDFSNVYALRLQTREMEIPTIISYLRNPTGILIPVLIFICLKNKKFLKALILIIIQLAMYGFGANKIHLLSIGVCIVVALFREKRIYYWVLIGLCLFLTFSIVYDHFNHELDTLTNILIRRTMFTPHKMCHDYYTCFTLNQPDYWRSSFLRYFGFESPYGELTYYIGIYNGTLANCDNGLVGDAYGNFGYYSLLIYPFLYFFLFTTYNIMCRGIKKEIILFFSIIYAVVIYDAPFFTVLLTHGYLFMFVLFTFIFPFKSNIESESLSIRREKIVQKHSYK